MRRLDRFIVEHPTTAFVAFCVVLSIGWVTVLAAVDAMGWGAK